MVLKPFNKKVNYIFPNAITLASLVFGLFAIKLSFEDKLELAILLILFSAFLDTLDGLVARALKASSNFGVQMDSLCDSIAFGVAPAFIAYNWMLYEAGSFGFMVATAITICSVLRLARFNVSLDKPATYKHHFVGIPAPGGGMLALAPIAFSEAFDFHLSVYIYAIYVLAIAILMVSHVPTISLKHLRIPKKFRLWVLFFVAIFLVYFVQNFWAGFSLISIFYIISLFVISLPNYLKRHKKPL